MLDFIAQPDEHKCKDAKKKIDKRQQKWMESGKNQLA